MSLTSGPPSTRAARPHATWLLLALVLSALAILALMIPSLRDWRGAPASTTKTVIKLTITPQSAAEVADCSELSPALMEWATSAVAATFNTNGYGVATYTADRWFRGGPADLVEIRSDSAVELDRALSDAGLDSGRVLIASRSGEVQLCGVSAAYSTELGSRYIEVYEQGAGKAETP